MNYYFIDRTYPTDEEAEIITSINEFDYTFPDNRKLSDILEDVDLYFYPNTEPVTVPNPRYEGLLDKYNRIESALRTIPESEIEKESMDELRAIRTELYSYGDPKEWQYTRLGKYIRNAPGDKPVIVLFIKAIRNKCYYGETVLPFVYVHEIMHAYFDHDHTKANICNKYVEEPITEYAMLSFIKEYDSDLLSYAVGHVREKQKCRPICFYGFGFYLHNYPRWFDWIQLMYHHKYKEFGTPSLRKYEDTFVKGLYPKDKYDEYDHMRYLLDILYDKCDETE